MFTANITHQQPPGGRNLRATMLVLLAVFILVSCTGCSLFNGWLEDMRGYNSNDATMSDWGNPTY
jgi:hypothetical protein